MPYVIGRRSSGVYEVVETDSIGNTVATKNVVTRKGEIVMLDHADRARELCRAMNRERLRAFRAKKASQMKLFGEEKP